MYRLIYVTASFKQGRSCLFGRLGCVPERAQIGWSRGVTFQNPEEFNQTSVRLLEKLYSTALLLIIKIQNLITKERGKRERVIFSSFLQVIQPRQEKINFSSSFLSLILFSPLSVQTKLQLFAEENSKRFIELQNRCGLQNVGGL